MTGRSLPCEPRRPWHAGVNWHAVAGITIFVLILVFFLVVIYSGVTDLEERHKAFVDECMADGHKHYECEALWGQARGGVHSVPLPTK